MGNVFKAQKYSIRIQNIINKSKITKVINMSFLSFFKHGGLH